MKFIATLVIAVAMLFAFTPRVRADNGSIFGRVLDPEGNPVSAYPGPWIVFLAIGRAE